MPVSISRRRRTRFYRCLFTRSCRRLQADIEKWVLTLDTGVAGVGLGHFLWAEVLRCARLGQVRPLPDGLYVASSYIQAGVLTPNQT